MVETLRVAGGQKV